MFHFYFGESIPNITDWIQALGAIAIFWTLYLQYQANQNQQKQLRVSLIPKFSAIYREQVDFADADYISFTIKIKLERNLAYSVSGKLNNAGDCSLSNDLVTISMQEGELYLMMFELEFVFQPANIDFDLQFEDILGNKYSQNFILMEKNFFISAPTLKN